MNKEFLMEQQSQILARQEELMMQAGEYLRRAIDALVLDQQSRMPEAPDPAIEMEKNARERRHYIRLFTAQALANYSPSPSEAACAGFELWEELENRFAAEELENRLACEEDEELE